MIQHNLPILVRTTGKGAADAERVEQGIPLAPSEKDRRPWYSDKNHERNREADGDKRCVQCFCFCPSVVMVACVSVLTELTEWIDLR